MHKLRRAYRSVRGVVDRGQHARCPLPAPATIPGYLGEGLVEPDSGIPRFYGFYVTLVYALAGLLFNTAYY